MKEKIFAAYFRSPPTNLNLEPIREQWLALAPPYDVDHWLLPLPVWGHRNYDHTGPEAWDVLRRDLADNPSLQPFCLYVHVPFCSSKCRFCDCYSFKLGSHCQEQIDSYVQHVCDELRLWSQQGQLGQRPVSTVHLGGGTPTFLGEAALTRLTACCREHFHITPDTEWALESTVEGLTSGMVATMQELGYRRLHIGVQSLDEPVRQEIKRRRPVAEVLQKIEETLAMGWVVSVDMVCGLPYQTINSLVADIETLLALGVNGVSLYELLIYPQNQRWAEAYGLTKRGHVGNYFMFQAGASVLQQRGLRQNLFNHWADPTDQNIYFTYPTRGEDCLAVGTIADGVLGDYHFRHPRYGAYNRELAQGWPGLQGGLRRTTEETALLPWLTAILSGHINPPLATIFRSLPVYGTDLLSFWQEQRLIESESGEGAFRLMANGAWFAGNMVRQVMALGQGIAGKNSLRV